MIAVMIAVVIAIMIVVVIAVVVVIITVIIIVVMVGPYDSHDVIHGMGWLREPLMSQAAGFNAPPVGHNS